MKILLTGSSGFIGKNIKENLTGDFCLKTPNSAELNLLDTDRVYQYLKEEQFDIIIHSANRNNTRKKNTTFYDSLDGNLRMFYNLARCSHLFGRMYYFGSGAEYDMQHYSPDMKEEYFDTHVPKDPYGFSKYIMSKHCEQSNNIYDLRLFGVYGRYEEWERRFISNAICRALKGMPITLQKNVYFDYLWVNDLVQIINWFIQHEPIHKHYNVCRGSKVDLYSLACLVREVLHIDCDIIVGEPGQKPEYTGNNERLLNEIGNFQFTTFEDSIGILGNYYKENLDRIDETLLL